MQSIDTNEPNKHLYGYWKDTGVVKKKKNKTHAWLKKMLI